MSISWLNTRLIVPVYHDGGGGEYGAVGERPDLGEAALVGEDPVELGDALLVDAVLEVLQEGVNSPIRQRTSVTVTPFTVAIG